MNQNKLSLYCLACCKCDDSNSMDNLSVLECFLALSFSPLLFIYRVDQLSESVDKANHRIEKDSRKLRDKI